MEPPDLGTIDLLPNLPTNFNDIIRGAVVLALAIAGLIFFAMLLVGGFRYLTAGGDEKAAQEARKTLTNAGIGLVIIVASFLVAELLFRVFGLYGLILFTSP